MQPLLDLLGDAERVTKPGLPMWRGTLHGSPILAVIGGMGKVNAAHAVTVAVHSDEVARVVGFGVGGAYAGSELSVGDVAVATVEHYGDEGVETPDGWLSCEGIGIPLLQQSGTRLFNAFPVDAGRADKIATRLNERGVKARRGPFVTVSCCSGTTARGGELARRFGAICESMEGAAYAHIAARYELPYLGVRGISNLVEDRDFTRWRLHEAAEAASVAVATSLQIDPA